MAVEEQRTIVPAALVRWIVANPQAALSEFAERRGITLMELGELCRQPEVRESLEKAFPDGNPKCPSCGGNSARIGHGDLPNHFPLTLPASMASEFLMGRAILDGCIVTKEQWVCRQCRYRWPSEWPRRMDC